MSSANDASVALTRQQLELSQAELNELRQAFELFDTEKKGSIPAHELRDVLLKVFNGEDASIAGVLESLKALPKDQQLSMDDFVALLSHRGGPNDNRNANQRLFDLFDTAGKGFIDLEDLRAISTGLGENLSEDDLNEMIARVSSSGEATVTYDDFVTIMTKSLFSN